MIEKHGLLFAKAIIALSDAKMLCVPIHNDGQKYITPIQGIIRVAQTGSMALRRACLMSDIDDIIRELDRFDDFLAPSSPIMPLPQHGQLAQAITHLLSRLQDNLDQQFFFHVTQQDVRFYGQKTLFGDKVAQRFKKADNDIEAAGNCLALQQPTACVFHLMRAMEVAVQNLSERLHIKVTPKTTWRVLTGAMDQKIRKMKDDTEVKRRKKNKWETASTNLHHVGSVWRNNTMHPATSYTRSQAHDVFNAVRVFMNDLADL